MDFESWVTDFKDSLQLMFENDVHNPHLYIRKYNDDGFLSYTKYDMSDKSWNEIHNILTTFEGNQYSYRKIYDNRWCISTLTIDYSICIEPRY